MINTAGCGFLGDIMATFGNALNSHSRVERVSFHCPWPEFKGESL